MSELELTMPEELVDDHLRMVFWAHHMVMRAPHARSVPRWDHYVGYRW